VWRLAPQQLGETKHFDRSE